MEEGLGSPEGSGDILVSGFVLVVVVVGLTSDTMVISSDSVDFSPCEPGKDKDSVFGSMISRAIFWTIFRNCH